MAAPYDSPQHGLSSIVPTPTLEEVTGMPPEVPLLTTKKDPRCKVCNSPDDVQFTLHRLSAAGFTYQACLDVVKPLMENWPEQYRFGYDSLYSHLRKHMPFEQEAIRRIIERRAEREQKDFKFGVENVLSSVGYAELMLHKASLTLQDEKTVVSPTEGLQAAKALWEFLKDTQQNADVVQAVSQLQRIIEAVKQVCSPEQMSTIAAILKQAPPETPAHPSAPLHALVEQETHHG